MGGERVSGKSQDGPFWGAVWDELKVGELVGEGGCQKLQCNSSAFAALSADGTVVAVAASILNSFRLGSSGCAHPLSYLLVLVVLGVFGYFLDVGGILGCW